MTKTNPIPIARGDRREEVHYEDDAEGLVRASHLFKPAEPSPADVAGSRPGSQIPPVEDVAVVAESPSVWEALPPEAEP